MGNRNGDPPGDSMMAEALQQMVSDHPSGVPARQARKKRITFDLRPEIVEELRDCVVYAQYHGRPDITQTGLVERGLLLAIQELGLEFQVEHFPPRRDRRPRVGPPPL